MCVVVSVCLSKIKPLIKPQIKPLIIGLQPLTYANCGIGKAFAFTVKEALKTSRLKRVKALKV